MTILDRLEQRIQRLEEQILPMPEPISTHDKSPVPISGIWLRRIGDEVQVLFEYEDRWYMGISEFVEGSFSHIMEPLGMRSRIEKEQYDPVAEESGKEEASILETIARKVDYIERALMRIEKQERIKERHE